jgi:hypothetical protein
MTLRDSPASRHPRRHVRFRRPTRHRHRLVALLVAAGAIAAGAAAGIDDRIGAGIAAGTAMLLALRALLR